MSNIPLGDDLKQLFDDVTNGRAEPPVRAILVQNDNGTLRLVNSLPAEGADKEDFVNVLGKLFASEPSKPGYALFRLDEKSPAGLYQWLNCAFRPESAKVREKMQYAVTQASLFKGLSEQHFLETVYGSTAADFAFPTRLRNARKHDYQNPQQQIKGKPAAEAAGADAGGARRNFDAVSAAARSAAVAEKEVPKQASAVDLVQSSEPQAHDVKQLTPAAELETVTAPQTESKVEENVSLTKQEPVRGDPEPDSQLDTAAAVTKEEAVKADSEAVTSLEKDSTPSQTSAAPAAEAEQVSAPPKAERSEEVTSTEVTSSKQSLPPAQEQENPATPSTSTQAQALETPPTSNVTAAGLAAETTVIPQSNGTDGSTADAAASTTLAPAPVAAAEPKAPSSSIGVGKGAEGLETERERHLASIKAEESQNRSSGPRPGGPRTGFKWKGDVEPAVQRLAGEEINLVVLKLDLGEEEVQLAQQPAHVAPEEVASTLANIGTDEPLYALYAHPQASTEAAQRSVGLIYACPSQSTVRQRMLYSLNMTMLSKLVDAFDGISLNKRAETSDVNDLTADFLRETFTEGDDGSDEAPSAAKLSRPKRPGRK